VRQSMSPREALLDVRTPSRNSRCAGGFRMDNHVPAESGGRLSVRLRSF
jgi:hypothetical protein